jgi:ribulose-5-phosphate 4-epimerase/fuculose-1-phosphate aldolase
MSSEDMARDEIVRAGALLYDRGLAHGSAGNLSIRLDDGSVLVTPTNSCLGFLERERLSKVSVDGDLLSGDPPSKEAFFHLALYRARASARAIVHLHSTYSVAVSCLCHESIEDVLPPLTAYHVMRIGRLPMLRYYRPGDRALADAVGVTAQNCRAMLLANHGPIVSGKSLEDAIGAYEELEETAKLFFLLAGKKTSPLRAEEVAELNRLFPS